MTFRRYAIALLCAALCLGIAAAAINVVIDPYGLFNWVRVEGVNAKKAYAYTHKHLAKQTRALRLAPRTVLLGNSRVDIGFDPKSEAWPDTMRPVANLAIPGDDMERLAETYEFAQRELAPTTIFIGLDFFDFLFAVPARPETRLPLQSSDAGRVLPKLPEAVFSTTALLDSFKTIVAQYQPASPAMTDAGFNPMRDYRAIVRREGQWPMVNSKNRQHAQYLVQRSRSVTLPDGEPTGALVSLRDILTQAAAYDQHVVLFTYPLHGHFYALLDVSERWPLFEEWKRAIVAQWQAVQTLHPEWSSAFWDFALLTPITTEPAPLPGNRDRRMQWYWEPGHFKAELGSVLIGQLTETAGSGFGERFIPSELEEHLARQRLALADYMRAHPEDVAYLRNLCEALGCTQGF